MNYTQSLKNSLLLQTIIATNIILSATQMNASVRVSTAHFSSIAEAQKSINQQSPTALLFYCTDFFGGGITERCRLFFQNVINKTPQQTKCFAIDLGWGKLLESPNATPGEYCTDLSEIFEGENVFTIQAKDFMEALPELDQTEKIFKRQFIWKKRTTRSDLETTADNIRALEGMAPSNDKNNKNRNVTNSFAALRYIEALYQIGEAYKLFYNPQENNPISIIFLMQETERGYLRNKQANQKFLAFEEDLKKFLPENANLQVTIVSFQYNEPMSLLQIVETDKVITLK